MDSNGFKRYVYAAPKKDPCSLNKRVSMPGDHHLGPEKLFSDILSDLETLHTSSNDFETRKWMAKILPLLELLNDLKQTSTSDNPSTRKQWLEKTILELKSLTEDHANQPANPALKNLINKIKGS